MDKPRVNAIEGTELNEYIKYIDNFPDIDDPNIFELNQNGQKTYLIK